MIVTPETLSKEEFNKVIVKSYQRGEINRLVVDEAHCISVSLSRILESLAKYVIGMGS